MIDVIGTNAERNGQHIVETATSCMGLLNLDELQVVCSREKDKRGLMGTAPAFPYFIRS